MKYDSTLADQFPEVAATWDYEKNAPLTPEEIAPHSNKKYGWRCSKGHTWTAQVNSRTRPNGGGCPVCSGKIIVPGVNDLATLRPDLANEWDYEKNKPLTPEQIGLGSNKIVAWICERQHRWLTQVGNRTGVGGTTEAGSKCPYCSGKRALSGENDLATLYPRLAEEWDFAANRDIMPSDIRPGSNKKVFWVCRVCGHKWAAKVQDRALKGYGCPQCSGKCITPGINDCITACPMIVNDWDYAQNEIDPHTLAPKSNKLVNWCCHICGGQWTARISDYVSGKSKCPNCRTKDKKDFASIFPEMVKDWDNLANGTLSPDMLFPESSKRIHWNCHVCGYAWDTRLCDRTRYHTGCPRCAGKIVTPGVNDLATLYPEIAEQWCWEKNAPLGPDEVLSGSRRKAWWQCKCCGQTWETSIDTRTQKHTGCPYCAGKRPIPGKNDFATLHPELLTEWAYDLNSKSPGELTEQSNYKASWRCKKGHTWKATVHSRVSTKCGCPYCAGKLAIPGETDLATLRPDLAAQWHPSKNTCSTTEITVSSGKKAVWLCAHGHEWSETVASRLRGDGQCPSCAGNPRRYKGVSF